MKHPRHSVSAVVVMLVLGMVTYAPRAHAQGIVVAVEPNQTRDPTKGAGTSFQVELVARDVPVDTPLYGFQATVRFDAVALTVPSEGATFGSQWQAQIAADCGFPIGPTIAADSVTVAITLIASPGCSPGFSGTVPLVGITFNVDQNDVQSIIDIDEENTILSDVNAIPLPYTSDDGFFSNGEVTNAPPSLAAVGNKTVVEGSLLQFTATATDPEDGPLTWSLTLGQPAATGAAIGATTGVFTWTPNEDQGPGNYPVTITVTDSGGLTDSETILITVSEPQRAPPASPPLWVEYWWAILLIAVIIAVPVARAVMRSQSQKLVTV